MRTTTQKTKVLTGVLFCVGLLVVSFFIIMKQSVAEAHAATPTVDFSQMSEEDCIDFIIQNDI